jgi:transposase
VAVLALKYDALGNPLVFCLTAGQVSDISQADALLDKQLADKPADALLADRAYDANQLLDKLERLHMKAVIPPKSNRLVQRDCNFYQYKERHLVECFFGKLKQYRRVFTRFDKYADNYMSFITFASALIWLR